MFECPHYVRVICRACDAMHYVACTADECEPGSFVIEESGAPWPPSCRNVPGEDDQDPDVNEPDLISATEMKEACGPLKEKNHGIRGAKKVNERR